jgi:hypothetical protein
MATAYTTIGSKFQPYTLAEMLVPYQAYKQEFDKREELYNTYAENAGLIGSQLDDTLDKDLIDTVYNPYMQELNRAASELSSKGLSPENRKNLQNLRRRFGSDIAPIKVATEARAEARKNWDKLSSQDKTLMTNANPYYQAVSSYMNGKSPETYYVSGNELYGRGKALAEAFSKTLREVPNGEELANTLGGQYYRITRQYGPDSKQMQDFMNDVADSIPELRSQVEDILSNTDISKEGFTDADRNKARQYIIEGMKAGLSGNTEVQYLENKNFIDPYKRWQMRDTPPPPEESPIFYDFVGTEITPDEDANLKQMNSVLNNLIAYKESVDKGETVSPYTTRMGYANKLLDDQSRRLEEYVQRRQKENPNWNPNTDTGFINLNRELTRTLDSYARVGASVPQKNKEYRTENPIYADYDKLAKQFGNKNINALIQEQQKAIFNAIHINKYAKFKNTQSGYAMRDLRTNLMSGITDRSDSKQVRKMIHKLGNPKDAPDEETLKKIFEDTSATIQFNPYTGKAIIEGKEGTYEINKEAAFHNIYVPTPFGIMSGDEALDDITAFAQQQYDNNNKEAKAVMNVMLNSFFAALNNSYNGGAPEASKTSNKASTFPIE